MKRLLCYLTLHYWYRTGDIRTCKWCQRKERLTDVYGGAMGEQVEEWSVIPRQITLDRKIAYNKEKSSQVINFLLCICAVIGIVVANYAWPDETLHGTRVVPPKDTIYTWYDHNGNGHIGFLEHSKLERP